MRVRIENATGVGRHTRITSVETGESLDYITGATISLAPDRGVVVHLTQAHPVIDVVAEATVTVEQMCPYCGQIVENK